MTFNFPYWVAFAIVALAIVGAFTFIWAIKDWGLEAIAAWKRRRDRPLANEVSKIGSHMVQTRTSAGPLLISDYFSETWRRESGAANACEQIPYKHPRPSSFNYARLPIGIVDFEFDPRVTVFPTWDDAIRHVDMTLHMRARDGAAQERYRVQWASFCQPVPGSPRWRVTCSVALDTTVSKEVGTLQN